MSSAIKSIMQTVTVVALLAIICSVVLEAKLLRRQRIYDDQIGGYDGPYSGGATGERAILTVRGARNPYDGSAPARIAIEDNPYRGPYPRGVYDRLESGYSRQRMPYYPQQDYGYSGYGRNYGGYQSGSKRRDFLAPDFGIKASLNLASKKRNRCKLKTEADSEIPELGLDSANLNIDCDINPSRVADAAMRVAQSYNQYRRKKHHNKKAQPPQSGSEIKRKRTSIHITRDYEKARDYDDGQNPKVHSASDDEDDDD